MHLAFRKAIWARRSRRSERIGVHDLSRISMRALPTDIDELGHINNGQYQSIMDIGRRDLMIRSGIFDVLRAKDWYPVVASSTTTYRRSVQLFQRFTLETRVAGYDERAAYLRARFVVGGDVFAESMAKCRFLRRAGGAVTTRELADALALDTDDLSLPTWVQRWSDDVRLPSTRQPAPSVYDR